MIIGCDIDGVLADFNTAFIQRVIDVTGRDLFPPRPFDIPTWNYPEHYGYTAAEVSAVWASIKLDISFWVSLPPYGDAIQALAMLDERQCAGDEIYFVTARPGLEAKRQTENWLSYYGFRRPTVLISSQKGLCAQALKLDKYLDDRWENVVDVAAGFTQAWLLARPWNRDRNPEALGIVEAPSVAAFLRC